MSDQKPEEKPTKVPDRQPEELSQIARDIVKRQVFTDRHVRSMDDLSLVFMVIPLGAFKDCAKEYVEDVGMIFEYMDKAGPRSINGYPMFLSMQILSKHDAKIVWEKVTKLEELMATV